MNRWTADATWRRPPFPTLHLAVTMNPFDPFAAAAFDDMPMHQPIDPPIVVSGGAPQAQGTPVVAYGAMQDPPIVVTGG